MIVAANDAKTASEVRATTVKGILEPQSITAAFEQTGKGKVMYSHRQHTRMEARCAGVAVSALEHLA